MTTRRQRRNPRQVSKIPVVVVDSQVLFRTGVQRLLNDDKDVEILGHTGDSNEALSLIERLSPRVAMLSTNLAPQKGIELAGVIRRHHPETYVILSVGRVEEKRFSWP